MRLIEPASRGKPSPMRALLPFLVLLTACTGPAQVGGEAAPAAQTAAMTGAALTAIVRRIDADAQVEGNGAIFRIDEREMMLVFDEAAGRMRVITPIIPAGLLDEGVLIRMSQANYDAALDARYAVAND